MIWRRYADPMGLLGAALRQHRFAETVCKIYEESSRQQCWEFFLHQVLDKSFQEFMDGLQTGSAKERSQHIRKEDVPALIRQNIARFEKMQFGAAEKIY